MPRVSVDEVCPRLRACRAESVAVAELMKQHRFNAKSSCVILCSQCHADGTADES